MGSNDTAPGRIGLETRLSALTTGMVTAVMSTASVVTSASDDAVLGRTVFRAEFPTPALASVVGEPAFAPSLTPAGPCNCTQLA